MVILLSPMQGQVAWSFILIVLLLMGAAMFSSAEVGYFSLSQKEVDELPGDALRRRVQNLLSKPKKLLATILIGHNAVLLAIVIISELLADYFFEGVEIAAWLRFLIQVVAVTFIILLFGDVMPKVYATHNPKGVARLLIGPITFLNRLFTPLSAPLMLSSSFIDKRIRKHGEGLSAGELNAVIEMTKDATVTEEEKKIWKGVVEFGTISVKETMKPRIDVVAVDVTTGFRQLLTIILQAGYSRVPVYRDSFDHIEGVLYIKDLLPYLEKGDDFEWQSLLRPPMYVPENKKIDDLLKEFQSRKMHIAIVVDEFGGSSGIVTLEDLIEEIVGEINDEFDDVEIVYSKLDDLNFVFEGKTTLINLCRITGIPYEDIEEFAGDSDTLAGLILQLNGKLPERNQVLDCNNLRFTIESVDRRRIKRIKVTRLNDETDAEV